MEARPPELLVVMPVFNEQTAVRKTVLEWFAEIERATGNFVFLAIDDGSKDGTPAVLAELRAQFGNRFEVLSRENRGHGQSCIQGYRIARERGIPYVFQMDSDGQCDPQYFPRFWAERERYDVIYGRRTRRDDGWKRTFASFVVRMFLLTLFRVNCIDANVPYRLMRVAALDQAVAQIPPDFRLANIALAVLLRREGGIREGRIPIHFRDRYGGEPSVTMGKFGHRAGELYRQLKGMLGSGSNHSAARH